MKTARLLLLGGLVACGGDDADTSCKPDDADGIVNVALDVALTVDDSGFQPTILKTQNSSAVTLTLTNAGTKPHGFAVDCLATPNTRGCPAESGSVATTCSALQCADDEEVYASNWTTQPRTGTTQPPASIARHISAAPPRTVVASLSLHL